MRSFSLTLLLCFVSFLAADEGKLVNIYRDIYGGRKTEVHISSGRLLLVPTFENCSYYVNRTPAERGKNCTLEVFYRKKGAKDWTKALDPVNMEKENAWRGSLMLLEENTPYEFLGKVKGAAKAEIMGSFTTRSSKFNVAETIVLDRKNFTGYLKVTKSGKPGAYVRYTSAPGFVLEAKKGGVTAIDAEKVRFVIFDGLTIKANASRHCIRLTDCEDVVVSNCDLSGFGRTDGVRDMKQRGRWTHRGKMTGWDGGIFIGGGKRHLVERCYIHDPHSTSNSWFYSHPTGPEAIFIDRSRGGTVIRYNDFIGSDAKRWNDAIETSGNGAIDGGFGRDADIYGNHFAFSDDDSIEIEGGEMNIRVYYNLFQGSYCGVSTGCCRLGPSYQFRNVFYRLGDENNRFGIPFKNGMGNQGDGAVFFINNTVWSPGVKCSFGGFHSKPPVYNPPLKAWSRNNIVNSSGSALPSEWKRWNCQADNDLFYGASQEVISVSKKFLADWGQEKNALFAEPGFVDPASGDLRLKPDSPARNRAVAVPGLKTTHLGAFQPDGLEIPRRPFPVKASPAVLNFDCREPGKTLSFTLEGSQSGFKGSFKVLRNDDFFTVTPESGTLTGREKIRFTVKLDPEKILKPRICNGLALIRFSDGFSRAVTVYADFREDPARKAESLRHAVVIPAKWNGKGTFRSKVRVPRDGCYFLLAKGNFHGFAPCTVTVGPVKSPKKARFITRDPGFAAVRNDHLSAWYIFLKKGEQNLTFSTVMKCSVDEFYLTREPEWFLK